MNIGQKVKLKRLLSLYDRKIFAFAVNLLENRSKAQEVTASSFAETVIKTTPLQKALVPLVRAVVRKCRLLPPNASFDESDRLRVALHLLPFDSKAMILMRDQIGFSYGDIGALFHLSAEEAKRKTVKIRKDISHRMEELRHEHG